MKFGFFALEGALVVLLMLPAVFCDPDHPQTNSTAEDKQVDIPCSLDDTDGNRTECRNASQVSSNSSESSGMTSTNSNDLIGTTCPPGGCSTDYEPEINSTSLENIGITETNPVDDNIKSERNTSETISGRAITTLSETNLVENATDHSALVTVSNETFASENGSNESAVGITETASISNAYELTTQELHDNSSLIYSGNASMSSQARNVSVFSTEEPLYSDNSTVNTTPSSVTIHDTEENITITDNTEPSVTITSDYFSHISDVTSNSTETLNNTFIDLHNITGDDSNVPSLTTRPMNDSFDNNTEIFTENVTNSSYPVTDSQSTQDFNVTSTTDNSTLFTNMTSSLNSSDPITPSVTEENTNSSADTTTITSSKSPVTPSNRISIVVELRINCTGNTQENDIAVSVAQLLNGTLEEDYEKDCSILHNVTVSVVPDSIDFESILKLLSKHIKNAEINRVISKISANKTVIHVTISDSGVTQSEMILYITLGACLGVVLLISLAIICFKCCRRRPSKPIDVDVPHLNLRLEDFTLTRIPRPNTVYLDYFRGPIVNDQYAIRNSMNAPTDCDRGLIQPFDTSVVPLEDAKKIDHLAISAGRTSSTCPSTPLRTFGRKDRKHGDNLVYENVMSSSTEKLHPDFYTKYGYPGIENQTFAA